jgi:hypothetical protein
MAMVGDTIKILDYENKKVLDSIPYTSSIYSIIELL